MDTCRNKCGGCYRQFNKKEHLVEHMRISYHSVHEPTCGICNKHCRSFDSLREHLIGIYISNLVHNLSLIFHFSSFHFGSYRTQGHCRNKNVRTFSAFAAADSVLRSSKAPTLVESIKRDASSQTSLLYISSSHI